MPDDPTPLCLLGLGLWAEPIPGETEDGRYTAAKRGLESAPPLRGRAGPLTLLFLFLGQGGLFKPLSSQGEGSGAGREENCPQSPWWDRMQHFCLLLPSTVWV